MDGRPEPGGGPREAPRALHAVLFFCALATTLWVGTELLPEFAGASPSDHLSALLDAPATLVRGLPFSLSLLFILGVHEWGHLASAWRSGVRASWPYFIPGPPYLSVGTFGAFIKLRGAIPHREALLRLGASGPAAGFAACALVFGAGKALLLAGYRCPTDLGVNVHLPLAYRALDVLCGGAGRGTLLLFENPLLAAAWLGFFVQGLNLLPCGQLDGGHILYAVAPRRHRLLGTALGVALFALSPWGFHFAVWGALLLFLGYGHPPCVDDRAPLSLRARFTAAGSAALLALCFHPLPFQWV